MIAEITVRPGMRRFRLYRSGGRLMADLESEAERNRANVELITELSRLLGCGVRIVSGQSARRKRLSLPLPQERWDAFLSSLPEGRA